MGLKEDSLLNKYPHAMDIEYQQMLDKSKSSFEHLAKLVLSLSVGSVATFFVVLTRAVSPAMTEWQALLVLGAVICMTTSTLTGLSAWFFDSWAHYCWGMAIKNDAESVRSRFISNCDTFRSVKKVCFKIEICMFIVGVIFAFIYIVLRLKVV